MKPCTLPTAHQDRVFGNPNPNWKKISDRSRSCCPAQLEQGKRLSQPGVRRAAPRRPRDKRREYREPQRREASARRRKRNRTSTAPQSTRCTPGRAHRSSLQCPIQRALPDPFVRFSSPPFLFLLLRPLPGALDRSPAGCPVGCCSPRAPVPERLPTQSAALWLHL